VSDKLHRHREFRVFTFEHALAWEILGAFVGALTLSAGAALGSAIVLSLPALILAAAFQPLLKVAAGLA
jgi:hypothetical protein